MKYCLHIFLVMLLAGVCSAADEVLLHDGSRLRGRVQRVHQDVLIIDTDFAGPLQIEMRHVEAIVTDSAVHLKRQGQEEEFGILFDHEADLLVVQADDEQHPLDLANLEALWPAGTTSPLRERKASWELELGADLVGKTGNSEETNVAGNINALRDTDNDRLKLYGRLYRSTKNGDDTADERIIGIDYEHDLSERQAWYARLEFRQDELQNLDLRSTIATGYGYYFLKEQAQELRGRVGLLYRHESYDNGDTDSTMGLDLGVHHRYKFSKWADLVNDITYSPSVEEVADYRVHHESALDFALANSKLWTLRLGISNDYNSQPAGDAKRLDTTYFARLVLKLAR